MPVPKKVEAKIQDDFFNVVGPPVARDDQGVDGKHVSKSKPPQRNQHEIYVDGLIKPIVPRKNDGIPLVTGRDD